MKPNNVKVHIKERYYTGSQIAELLIADSKLRGDTVEVFFDECDDAQRMGGALVVAVTRETGVGNGGYDGIE